MEAVTEAEGLNDSKECLTLQRERSDSQMSEARLRTDDDTDDEEVRPRPRRGHAQQHRFRAQSTSSEEDMDGDLTGESRKSSQVRDVTYMIGKGQFLVASVLIDKGYLSPERIIIDHNTGAKIPHYAAHHGNIKFFRWMVSHYAKSMDPEEISSFFNSMLDFYKCTVSHYAVRQGHLPLLMYLTDVLKIGMYERDQFGYTILDYSLVYKKLYCFIFLYYRCGFK